MLGAGRTVPQMMPALMGMQSFSDSTFDVLSSYPLMPAAPIAWSNSRYESGQVRFRYAELAPDSLASGILNNRHIVSMGAKDGDASPELAKGSAKTSGKTPVAVPKTGGGDGADADLIRQVREVIFRAPIRNTENVFPPDLLTDRNKVKAKAAELQRFEDMGMLQSKEVREGEMLRLFRYATHRNCDVWVTALWLLQDYFPDELEEVTRAFEKDVVEGRRNLDYEVRLFVARSPFAERDVLINSSLHDIRVDRVALDNLLRRRLLRSLNSVPTELYMAIVQSSLAHRRLMGELLFSDANGGRTSVAMLKKLLERRDPDTVRKSIILAHCAGRNVPITVLLYAVRELNPTKGELLSLLGLVDGGRPKGVAKVTEELAVEIASGLRQESPDLEALSAMLPQRALKGKELELIRRAMNGDVPIADIIDGLQEENPDLEKLAALFPQKELTAGDLAALREDLAGGTEPGEIARRIMESVSSSLLFVELVNPPKWGIKMAGGDWSLLRQRVADKLIDADMLTAADLDDLAQRHHDDAYYILTRHPHTRVRHLLSILARVRGYDWMAFDNLSQNMERHPMLTWPALISWATMSKEPGILAFALARPEALIEQQLYHLEKANEVIARAQKRAMDRNLTRDTFVDGNWRNLRDTLLSGLLTQLASKIPSFTRILMAMESGEDGALEKALDAHGLIHTAEPLSREELEFEQEGLAGLPVQEMVRRLGDGELDVRQKIALLCEGDDTVALAAWDHLTDTKSKNRPRLLSKKRAIAWALRSNSLSLKLKVIDEPKILVEHLLALLSYSVKELSGKQDSVRKEKLREIKRKTIAALKMKVPERVGNYIDVLPEIQTQARKAAGFGFNPIELIDDARGRVGSMPHALRKLLNDRFYRDRARPLSLVTIYSRLMAFVKSQVDGVPNWSSDN